MRTLAVTVGLLAGVSYCMRSTKKLPKNWQQLKFEVLFQYHGLRDMMCDYWIKKCNRPGLLSLGSFIHPDEFEHFQDLPRFS